MIHIPVLLSETIEALQPERGGGFLDATLGLGGHSEALLKGGAGHLYAIDQDPQAIEKAVTRLEPFAKQLTVIQGNFGDLETIAEAHKLPKLQGILMDIGVSSLQLDDPERGFSFMHNGPLDMRMDPDNTVSAATIVNTWLEFKMVNLFQRYGEERLAKKIARAIVQKRRKHPFMETKELADLIVEQYHPADRVKKPHPATRVFQALRIEVNRELDVLKEGIMAALDLLEPGGRLVIITFHSLEDRIVKFAFREAEAQGMGRLVTKRPIIASESEIAENPRSRSAKLRVFEVQ